MNERRDLKETLKALLNDRNEEMVKLELLLQLELVEFDLQGLNSALGVLRMLQKSDLINDPLRLIRTQALLTATSLLLSAHDRFGTSEPAVQLLIPTHIECLLSYCNGSDSNIKSTAALCLSEMQLCFPGLIGPCASIIDTVAAFESSPAHQPLLQLLSLLATEEQTAAFLASQLPLLSTPAAVSVAIRLSTLGSPFLLQSFLHQLLTSFSLTAIAAAAKLADLLDEFRRQRLLNHILSLSQDPGLSAASRLVLLDVALYFSGQYNLNYVAPAINFSDGAHSRLKKVLILLSQPQVDITEMAPVVEEAATTKNKAVNARVIYLSSKFEELQELCQRLLVSATVDDLSFAPHLLQLLDCVPVLEPPTLYLKVLNAPSPPSHHLSFLLILLKQAVASRSAAIARPKESLNMVVQCISSTSEGISPSIAHQLLSICHQIIKVFDPSDFSSEMSNLLAAVASKSSEEDVVARVSSFESLLGCLADSKVREVLRAQKKGLVPGIFHKPKSLTILDKTLISLSLRVSKSSTSLSMDPELERSSDPLADYWPMVKSRQNIEINLNLNSHASEILEAVALYFEPLQPFGQLNIVLIGQMATKAHAKAIYTPERPYPCTFTVRAEFRKGNHSCCCSLPNLYLSFISLMQPIIGKQRKQVARAMWDQMTDWPSASIVVNSELARDKIRELRQFIVFKGQEGTFAAAYLAPNSHLLIKCGDMEEISVKFIVKTDDVMLLAHANDFLKQVSSTNMPT